MNIILSLLFFLPFISAKISDLRTVKNICLADGELKFQLNITANDSVNDIFSTDLQNTCSLTGNNFTGNGTADFPYEITVNISTSDHVSPQPCGARVFNGSFAVEFAVKSGENFFQKYDRIYTLQCRIHNPRESSFITSKLNNEYHPPKDVPIQMTLVPVNPTQFSDGRVKLGEKVKLKIEILKRLRVQRGRVTLCFVQDSLHKNITHTFYSNKCPIESFPEPIKFMTNKTNTHLIESTGFKAFQFHDNGNVQFTCYVELCTNKKDPYCLASGCVPKGTFMHPYTKVKTSIHIDTSGATNQISFILMPAIAIMIAIFTKINMF